MKKSVRRGNAGAQRKMIDEFGAEKRFGCKLFDLLRVFSVIGYRAGLRLSKAGTRKQTQRKQKTSQDPHHRPPQGKNLGGDSIAAGQGTSSDTAREPEGLHARPGLSTARGPLAYDMRRPEGLRDRKSTRLNSSHPSISYALFCLKKKNKSS